ncbi:MAG: type I-U CRISPR-associated protein Csb2 [Planctomycetota bacterium]
MPTLVLRFPGGRYHATPGGHHVNEGIVEWPPSPWRLVRALIATGYSTQHWSDVPSAGRRLIEALSSALPEYRLPEGALGHSRHYMPTTRMKNGREETTLVLDTFADVGDGALWVRWPVTLDAESQTLFDTLAAHVGYLGRSESWVLGEAVADTIPLPKYGAAFSHSDGSRPGRGFEQVVLTAPERPEQYSAWRRGEVDLAVAALGIPAGKKRTAAQQKKIDAIERVYPPDLVQCLQCDTAEWKAHKWSQAPGARAVLYWRETNALEVGTPSGPRTTEAPSVEMMLLALMTPSGSRTALPTVARTLPQADLFRKGLMAKLGFGGEACPELVGRDASRVPLKGHAHAHIVPLDLDRDGHLDHVVVFARMGLGVRAQRAIRSLRRTYMKGGVGELQVAVAGLGAVNDLRNLSAGLSDAVEGFLGPRDGATAWVSATPFVPPRHLKQKGRCSLIGQIEQELVDRGFPLAEIDLLHWTDETLGLRHFVRRRRNGVQPPIDEGFPVRLRFDRPVLGPICLGYGSHFGLGRFTAE